MADVTADGLDPLHTQLARKLLGWTAQEFSDHCSVGPATVRNFEAGQKVRELSRQAMLDAIDAARVDRDGTTYRVQLYNGGQVGARLMKVKA